MISHYDLMYISLMISDVEHPFVYLLAICISFSGRKNVYSNLLIRLFINLPCNHTSSLRILDNNLLSDIQSENIFLLSTGCLFISFKSRSFLVGGSPS